VLTAFVRRHAPRPPTVPESEVAMDRRRAGWGWGQRGKVDPMFAAENLRDWRGHTVIDPEGHKSALWRRCTSTRPVTNHASSRSRSA
jgi:hypothetical protein